MKLKIDFDPREVRRALGLKQQDFWSRIGVTQSGGSRYEGGRRMPKPVQELLRVVHVEGIDLTRVNREDLEVLDRFMIEHRDLYQSISQELAAKRLRTAPAVSATEARPHQRFELEDDFAGESYEDVEIEGEEIESMAYGLSGAKPV